MPIKDLSDLVRLPRLGKIRLGMKVEKEGSKSYPKALDYFNCPGEVQAIFGEKPKSLEIMFPSDDPELFAPQYLKCYSRTQGLICIGDGETARRKVDKETGDIASHTTAEWGWYDKLICNPQECPEYMSKQCRRVMTLLFLLPDVDGLGVWQIDTTSFYSIVNTNSMIKLLKNLAGRCSFIPLTLSLGAIEVSPNGLKKKKVNVMTFTQKQSLAQIAQIGLRSTTQALLPEVIMDEAPDDLFPVEVIEGTDHEIKPGEDGPKATMRVAGEVAPTKPVKESKSKAQTVRDPIDYISIDQMTELMALGGWADTKEFHAAAVKRFDPDGTKGFQRVMQITAASAAAWIGDLKAIKESVAKLDEDAETPVVPDPTTEDKPFVAEEGKVYHSEAKIPRAKKVEKEAK